MHGCIPVPLPNGLRYLRVGGRGLGLGAEKTEPEKCLKTAQNPTRQVHALLARFLLGRTLFLGLNKMLMLK